MTVKRTPRSRILEGIRSFLTVSAFLIASCAGQELNSRQGCPGGQSRGQRISCR